MRSGVTLLITLSVIAAMMALAALAFGYVDRARSAQRHKNAMIQADLLKQNLVGAFKKALGSHPGNGKLKLLYTTPLSLSDTKGKMAVFAQCRPLLDRIPVTWLSRRFREKDPRRGELALEVFSRIADAARIQDPQELLGMIWMRLDSEGEARGLRAPVKGKDGIIDSKIWSEIVDEYRWEHGDPHAYEAPWDDVFVFDPAVASAKQLDKEFLSPRLVSILFDIDPILVKEGYTIGDLSRFLSDNGVNEREYAWLFGKKPRALMQCEGSFSHGADSARFRFDYVEGRIIDFGVEKD